MDFEGTRFENWKEFKILFSKTTGIWKNELVRLYKMKGKKLNYKKYPVLMHMGTQLGCCQSFNS